ncbi:MAG: tail fiber domain-containing protein [Geobacter sp.]|nr:tail fiber domain-containing protein [Geobacter sp.]
MKINLSFILAGLLMFAVTAFAGNGDLVVDGNVGIGTSTPSNKLTIDVGNSRNGISLFSDGDESVYSDILMAVKTPALVPAGQPTYYITSFRKDGYFSGGAATGPSLEFYVVRQGGGYYAPLSFKGNGDVILASNSNAASGNVGIGTTSPNGTLTVRTTPNSGRTLVLGTTTPSTVGEKDSEIIFAKFAGFYESWKLYSQSINAGNGSADLYLDAYDTVTTFKNVATFKNNGNVGIGTVAPAYTLDVNGTIRGSNVSPSDVRLKENIVPVAAAVEKVSNLRGVSFDWKQGETGKNFPAGRHYGVIAQEIEKVLPEVVSTAPDGTKAVAYTEIIPVLIEAIKEQQKRIEKLENILNMSVNVSSGESR